MRLRSALVAALLIAAAPTQLTHAASERPKTARAKPQKPPKQPRPLPPPRFVSSKQAFRQSNPCPATGLKSGVCPGYVIDYINPIACGGMDSPMNMQWDTADQAKALRKWERSGCKPLK